MTRLGRGKGGRVLEREYDETIKGMAWLFGWLASHTPDSRRDVGDPGRPDWLFVNRHTGAVLHVETKIDGGTLSEAQHVWFKALRAGGHEVLSLWLPGDLPVLERALRG